MELSGTADRAEAGRAWVGREQGTGRAELGGAVLLGGESLGGGEAAGDVGGREEAVVTDLSEALGQDVEEEAADELVGGQGAGPCAVGFEDDALVGDVDEAAAGEGDAVGVAAEVSDDLDGPAEGPFGEDDPGGLGESAEQASKGDRIGEVRAAAGEAERGPIVGRAQPVEELPPEQGAEHAHGEEEVLLAGDPARPVFGEATAGDDAVQVGVEIELPGLPDRVRCAGPR